jgi:hypothetical protein
MNATYNTKEKIEDVNVPQDSEVILITTKEEEKKKPFDKR